MIFRYARHTSDLGRIEQFYTEIVGLEKLGDFENHDTYNGIFLGSQGHSWHLEFTTSEHKPKNVFDDDDVLVFYCYSDVEFFETKKRLEKNNIETLKPKNPYWESNGMMISDPDGHNIVFAKSDRILGSNDDLTRMLKEFGITNWNNLVHYVHNLPYGRNANRTDVGLVIKEQQGTCSSKHSLLKKIADLNDIENVKLIIVIYKMNGSNTPKVRNVLVKYGLEYIPEAHCYVKVNNTAIDITANDSDLDELRNDFLTEIEIEPEQVDEYKVNYHKEFIKTWAEENNSTLPFDILWSIREECIKEMSLP